jgi:ABC-type nitrate/sulfonate/bicarbonate transport system permease component
LPPDPLTILWFGIEETWWFLFVACVLFVSPAVPAVIGADRYVETAQTLGASRRQIVTKS